MLLAVRQKGNQREKNLCFVQQSHRHTSKTFHPDAFCHKAKRNITPQGIYCTTGHTPACLLTTTVCGRMVVIMGLSPMAGLVASFWGLQVKSSQIAWLNLSCRREILIKISRNASHCRESRQIFQLSGPMVTTNHARPAE